MQTSDISPIRQRWCRFRNPPDGVNRGGSLLIWALLEVQHVIIRSSTAEVLPGREESVQTAILDLVRGFPAAYPGLLGFDVLIRDAGRVLIFLSHWRDEDAVAAFAGPRWDTDPVTFEDEEQYLSRPLQLEHYHVLDTYRRDAAAWDVGEPSASIHDPGGVS